MSKETQCGWGEVNPLSGLMYCSDCGNKMYVHRTSNYKNIPYFTCSSYTKTCPTAHRIKAENVLNLISEILDIDLEIVKKYYSIAQAIVAEEIQNGETTNYDSDVALGFIDYLGKI